jgi:peptide/nickel transport system substrate-binding protein
MEGAEPIADIRVRQAINHAINVEAMITAILGGRGFRAATLMTPDFAGYDPSVLPYEYDPQKAKDLLEEAGYSDGFTIDFYTWSSGPAPKPMELAQVAANDLAQVGITANVIPVDLQSALQMQYEKTLSPLHLWSWGGAQLDCREKVWGVFHPDSSAMHILDEEVVALSEELDATADQAERDSICRAMQARIRDQALIVPLFAQPDIYGKTTSINWTPRPDEHIYPWEITPAD